MNETILVQGLQPGIAFRSTDPSSGFLGIGSGFIQSNEQFEIDANGGLVINSGLTVNGNAKLMNDLFEDVRLPGMAIDAADNVWICDANGATVMKLSPEGKLLMILGVKGKRGDWNEARGQRLLWQPLDLAFAPNGDIYIGEGHANESPNDAGSDDPANNIGAARVIHLDKTGKFIN